MKTKIIKIGNSHGLRIPKPFLKKCALEGEVEMLVQGRELVVQKAHRPRAGWREAFQRVARLGDDKLLDKESLPPSSWDAEEWEWK